jgi:hypothetical protein
VKSPARALVALAVLVVAGVAGYGLVRWFAQPTHAPASAAQASGGAAVAPITAGAPPEIRRETVTIYLRADTETLALAGVPAEVVWFDAPVDRARQVVQLVLEGVPEARGAVPPAGADIRYRDVLIATDGTAWVDLDGTTLAGVAGTDEEQALIGALARSLTGALAEVRRVGVLVDGHPRTTLAGHVDLQRTYTGREWPALDDETQPAEPAPPDGAPPDGAPAAPGEQPS